MKLYSFPFLLLIISLNLYGQSVPDQTSDRVYHDDTLRLNEAEVGLAGLINDYRNSRNLPDVKLSASLSLVARMHVYDLARNYRHGSRCNLHSWSGDGHWSSCCYTGDHRKASCMWNKPRELSAYKGDGYEIAFYSNFNYDSPVGIVEDALAGWKTSRGHHELIVNLGKWATAEWKAMGVGVYGGFVLVWFGEQSDPAGEPMVLSD
ncbi:MAG: CAP domain-containing protein [Bacteroidota bacterium]